MELFYQPILLYHNNNDAYIPNWSSRFTNKNKNKNMKHIQKWTQNAYKQKNIQVKVNK